MQASTPAGGVPGCHVGAGHTLTSEAPIQPRAQGRNRGPAASRGPEGQKPSGREENPEEEGRFLGPWGAPSCPALKHWPLRGCRTRPGPPLRAQPGQSLLCPRGLRPSPASALSRVRGSWPGSPTRWPAALPGAAPQAGHGQLQQPQPGPGRWAHRGPLWAHHPARADLAASAGLWGPRGWPGLSPGRALLQGLSGGASPLCVQGLLAESRANQGPPQGGALTLPQDPRWPWPVLATCARHCNWPSGPHKGRGGPGAQSPSSARARGRPRL